MNRPFLVPLMIYLVNLLLQIILVWNWQQRWLICCFLCMPREKVIGQMIVKLQLLKHGSFFLSHPVKSTMKWQTLTFSTSLVNSFQIMSIFLRSKCFFRCFYKGVNNFCFHCMYQTHMANLSISECPMVLTGFWEWRKILYAP